MFSIITQSFLLQGYVERTYVVNDQARALMQVVSGKNGYKIVFLMRLTPIPFGIQNAIFAVSSATKDRERRLQTLPFGLGLTFLLNL